MYNNAKASELSVLRYKQVDSLRQYFPTVREVEKDAVYDVPLQLPTRAHVTLRVRLGAAFPQAPPILEVSPAVTHRLVDAQMRIRAEASSKLQQWHAHQNLGKTMYSIVQKLMQEPPTMGAPAVRASSSSPAPAAASASATSAGSAGSAGSGHSSVSVPPIPEQFPELQQMKPAQLGELLNDDAAFRKYLLAIESVRNMRSLRDDLRAGQKGVDENDSAALDAELSETRAKLAALKKQLAGKLQQQEQVMTKLQVSNLVEALDQLADDIELETDEMAREFLDGDIDIKQFQKNYVEKRELYHLRSAKKESLIIKANREQQSRG